LDYIPYYIPIVTVLAPAPDSLILDMFCVHRIKHNLHW
jgi:hypothetical protein